jgi:hypothetical protein
MPSILNRNGIQDGDDTAVLTAVLYVDFRQVVTYSRAGNHANGQGGN